MTGNGEADQAIEEYEKALQRKPDMRLVHLAIGDLYWKKFDDERAVIHYLAELKINPNSAMANYELGHAYLEMHQPERALPFLLEAVRLHEPQVYALADLGKLYMLQRQPAKAVPVLEAYLHQSPRDKGAHYKLYQAYKMLGRQTKAEEELAILRELDQAETQKPLKKAERIRGLEQAQPAQR